MIKKIRLWKCPFVILTVPQWIKNSLTETVSPKKTPYPFNIFFKVYEQIQFLEQKAMEIFNESFWIKVLEQDNTASICKTTKT